MVRFKCPNCAKGFTVDESCRGKKGKCPECKSIITIPETDEVLPAIGQKVSLPQNKDALDLKELQRPACLDNIPESVSNRYAEQESRVGDETERKQLWFLDIFLYPANITGVVMIAILAGIPFLVEVLPYVIGYLGHHNIIFGFLNIVIMCAGLVVVLVIALYKYWYFCRCILDSTEGDIRIPKGFGDNPGLGDMFSGLKNIIICLMAAFAPAIIYGCATGQLNMYSLYHFLVSFLPSEVLSEYMAMNRTFYILLALGIICFPMCLLSVVVHDSVGGLNPILLITSIFKTFFQYVGIILVFLVFFLVVQYFHYQIYYQRNILVWVCHRFVIVYLSLVLAHLLGRFYYKNSGKLGWL